MGCYQCGEHGGRKGPAHPRGHKEKDKTPNNPPPEVSCMEDPGHPGVFGIEAQSI